MGVATAMDRPPKSVRAPPSSTMVTSIPKPPISAITDSMSADWAATAIFRQRGARVEGSDVAVHEQIAARDSSSRKSDHDACEERLHRQSGPHRAPREHSFRTHVDTVEDTAQVRHVGGQAA